MFDKSGNSTARHAAEALRIGREKVQEILERRKKMQENERLEKEVPGILLSDPEKFDILEKEMDQQYEIIINSPFYKNKLEEIKAEIYRATPHLKVKKLRSTAKLPTKAHDKDAGFDLYCDLTNPGQFKDVAVQINPGEITKVETGIAVFPGDKYFSKIEGRSGLGSKGIVILGGVIDNPYTGELIVLMSNISKIPQVFSNGAKIAQLCIYPLTGHVVEEVELLEETSRGEKGFGSSDNV